jgi:hypothetical protein
LRQPTPPLVPASIAHRRIRRRCLATVTDVLPAQLTLVSANATGGTAVANVGTNTVTWNGAIAAGGSVTIVISATIDAGTTGSVVNQGSFTLDSDANGTNDASGTTDDPTVGGPADATTFVIAGGPAPVIQPVPVLGPFALAILAALLAFVASRCVYVACKS